MPYTETQHIRETDRLAIGWPLSANEASKPEAASTDAVTGFPTLSEFYRVGRPVVGSCLETAQPCSMAIIDIDHFRRLNENYDKHIVEQVLKGIASELDAACAGKTHLVSRLDEQEFGLLLVGLDGPHALAFCERLRKAIASVQFGTDDIEFSVTVSIGLAGIRGPESFDNYLNAAEQFLFMAKSQGRDRVFSDHTIVFEAFG